MIPLDLKPGALLAGVNPPTSAQRGHPVFVFAGYKLRPKWGSKSTVGLLIKDLPNHNWGPNDEGWDMARFSLIKNGDGSDYQPENDADLQQATTKAI